MHARNDRGGRETATLHYFPGTRATRARWMLEEVGLDYELRFVDLRKGAHKQRTYLAVHPLGKVPALEIAGVTLFESLAIALYLADRYRDRDLAPQPEAHARRAEYLKWMAFAVGTLEPAVIEQSRRDKAVARGLDPVDAGPALTPFRAACAYVERTLSERPFLLGEDFSAADVMNGSVMMWAAGLGLLAGMERSQRWIERLTRRSAHRAATAD